MNVKDTIHLSHTNNKKKNKVMKASYNFTYYGQPITRKEFEANVPQNWESQVKNYEFSWGGYRASERD